MMEITITKTDFEKALPIGTSAHDEIFYSLVPSIQEKQEILTKSVLGLEGETMLDTIDGSLKNAFIKTVCISAFLADFRQMDLVLTPTGFGIVNNDTVSPASKQRVDALEESLRTALLKQRALLIEYLRSPEWGVSVQAKNNIRYLYDDFHFFFKQEDPSLSYIDRNKIQSSIEAADDYLRKKISDEQMDYLLMIYRCSDAENLSKCTGLISAILRFTEVWIYSGETIAEKLPLQKLLRILESDPDTYSLYIQSKSYQANHYETFQNTPESSAFVFNG